MAYISCERELLNCSRPYNVSYFLITIFAEYCLTA